MTPWTDRPLGYVSREFLAEISGSHTPVVRLDVERDGAISTIPVTDGAVTVNYDDETRRSLDVTITDDGTIDLEAILDPALAVLRPYRGVRYPDGTEELVPLGVFYPRDVEDGETAGGVTWRVSAFDVSTRCQEALADPLFIAAGTSYPDAIVQLLTPKLPTLQFQLAGTPWVTPTLVIRAGTNPWAKARELAEAAGHDLYIDREGICTTETRLVTAADDPVWRFIEGDSATFGPPTRKRGADAYPNVVVVTGTNAAAGLTIRGEASDLDPTSSTYRYGPAGEHVLIVESEKPLSNEQATLMARSILSRKLGPQHEITFEALVNPALDTPDVVAITDSRFDLEGYRMIVAELNIPLTATALMGVTTRRSILTDAAGSVASIP